MEYKTEERVCDTCGSPDSQSIFVQQPHTKCIMIKGDDGKFVHNENVMCMECGLIYKPETMTRETLKIFYEEEYGKLYKGSTLDSISKSSVSGTMFNAVYVCDWFRDIKFDLKDKKTLDIGSGDGMFVRALQGEGADAYGIEISQKSSEIAKKLHGIDFAVGDIMEGVVIPTQFDMVSIRNVLEHVYSAKEFLNRAQELVNDNGYLLLELPSADRPYPAMPVDVFMSAAHIFTYTIDSVRELADECNMHVDKYAYSGHKSCMLILLKKGKINQMQSVNPRLAYTQIKETYSCFNKTFFNINEKIKELYDNSDVISIIRTLKEDKHSSNILAFSLLSTLIQDPTKRDIIAHIIDEYEWDENQAYDMNCCKASFEFYKSMMYKELGDFKSANNTIEVALGMYPNIYGYNFVRELKLEGVLSDSIFNEYLWFNCYRQHKVMG